MNYVELIRCILIVVQRLNKEYWASNCWKCKNSLFLGVTMLINAAIYSEGMHFKRSY